MVNQSPKKPFKCISFAMNVWSPLKCISFAMNVDFTKQCHCKILNILDPLSS